MTSLDGINGRSIQTLLRGENDSKQSDELQTKTTWDLKQGFVEAVEVELSAHESVC